MQHDVASFMLGKTLLEHSGTDIHVSEAKRHLTRALNNEYEFRFREMKDLGCYSTYNGQTHCGDIGDLRQLPTKRILLQQGLIEEIVIDHAWWENAYIQDRVTDAFFSTHDLLAMKIGFTRFFHTKHGDPNSFFTYLTVEVLVQAVPLPKG